MTVNRVPPLPQVFFLSVLWVCVYGCMRALKNHPPAFKPTPSPMHASSSLYASRVFSVINDLHEVCHTHTHTHTYPRQVRARSRHKCFVLFLFEVIGRHGDDGDRLGRHGGWANGGSAQECVFFFWEMPRKRKFGNDLLSIKCVVLEVCKCWYCFFVFKWRKNANLDVKPNRIR